MTEEEKRKERIKELKKQHQRFENKQLNRLFPKHDVTTPNKEDMSEELNRLDSYVERVSSKKHNPNCLTSDEM